MSKLFTVEAMVTQYIGHTDYAIKGYKSGYHNGLDVVPIDRMSWALFAPCGGEVKETGNHSMYGRYVILYNHRIKARYRFAHMDSVKVKRGEMVTVGQQLGVCGTTGNSTAQHLHIDLQYMRKYGVPDFVVENPLNGYSDPLPALREMGVFI